MTIADNVRAARTTLLETLADQIDALVAPIDEATFQDALDAALAAGVPAIRIATRCNFAVSTVTRWSKGAKPPVPIMRRLILPQVARQCRLHAELTRSKMTMAATPEMAERELEEAA